MKTLQAFGLVIITILVFATAVQAQIVPGYSVTGQSAAGGDTDAQRVLDQLSASGSSEQDLNALVAQLSDTRIRQIFLTVLRERLDEQTVKPQSAPVFAQLDSKLELIRDNLILTLKALPRVVNIPKFLFDSFNQGKSSFHIVFVIVAILVIYLIAYVGERLVDAGLRKWLTKSPNDAPRSRINKLVNHCNNFLSNIVRILVFSVIVFGIFFAVWQGHPPTRLFVVSVTTTVIAVRLALFLTAFALAPGPAGERLFAFEPDAARVVRRGLEQVIYALAVVALLNLFLAQFGFDRDAALAFGLLLGTLVLIMLVRLVLVSRRPVAALIRGPNEEPNLLIRGVAAGWYIVALLYLAFLYFGAIFSRLSGAPGDDEPTVGPGFISIAIVLAVPFVSVVARALADAWKEANRDGDTETEAHLKLSFVDVFYRVFRLGLIIGAIVLIARAWGVDFVGATESAIGQRFSEAIFTIAIAAILAYTLWLVVEVAIGGSSEETEDEEVDAGGEGGGAGATRLQTVLPLLRRFFQITILVIGSMIVLSSLGVNIGPLIAGAGVIGLAIGFGAQRLVTDIISGLFYLIDDAFRAGEYVDIGVVKGRVEATNVRSLVLRHHRGALHTVPYSEIKHLTNYSRDWVIMKLEFRVTYDTDINKVKKIFKQIGQDLLDDPVIGQDFLEPFKSQGVKSMEESAMIVRGKFMARPGKQFTIRKELYTRIQKAFEENDIHFAHRRVAVDLPPGFENHPQAEQIAEAAAAAAAAADEPETQGNVR
ncbi:MAG: mechanosensitive ion channel [Alphaproteobacteria bacterium]|nr:mechanosensitive ion channel [Alphaproteobacteria bacterium]